MRPNGILVFAPCAFNLGETSRMVEIAKAVQTNFSAHKAFDIHFIPDSGEFECLKKVKPAVVVTGSYVTIPVTCRVLHIPLVWVVQSTWLPDFFRHGAGMTDHVRPALLKAIADWLVMRFINFWIKYGFLDPVNRAANHFVTLEALGQERDSIRAGSRRHRAGF